MNWLIFTLTAYVLLALQNGLEPLLSVGGVSPDLLLILLVFIGLWANSMTVAWAGLALGLAVDFQGGIVPGQTIVGPAALGFLAGAYAVVQLRSLLFRESVLTLSIMTFAVGLFVELVIVCVFSMRGLPWITGEPVPGWSAANELVARFLDLLYTSIAALPVGWLLLRSTPLWAFPSKTRGGGH